MTGDQNDMLARLKTLLPVAWFPSTQAGQPTNSPVLDGLLSGCSALWAQSYALLQFVKTQTRIATASGVFLDMVAGDFFGSFLARRSGETDAALLTRIDKELFRRKGTRSALVLALTDLTGQAPVIFEPANTGDTGGYGQAASLAYGVAGGYGSLLLPYQFFVTAVRPHGGGVATVAGYGDIAAAVTGMPGGYGLGAIEYASLAMVAAPVTDAMIRAEIEDVRPAATVAWTKIVNSLPTPSFAPGAVTGLTVAPVNDGTIAKLAVSWTAPTVGGTTGAPTSYWIAAVPTSGATVTQFTTGTTSTLTGLQPGVAYTVTVTATNLAGGSSPASASATPYSVGIALAAPTVGSSFSHTTSPVTQVTVSPDQVVQGQWGTSATTAPTGTWSASAAYAGLEVWYLSGATAGTDYLWVQALSGSTIVGQAVFGPYTVT